MGTEPNLVRRGLCDI